MTLDRIVKAEPRQEPARRPRHGAIVASEGSIPGLRGPLPGLKGSIPCLRVSIPVLRGPFESFPDLSSSRELSVGSPSIRHALWKTALVAVGGQLTPRTPCGDAPGLISSGQTSSSSRSHILSSSSSPVALATFYLEKSHLYFCTQVPTKHHRQLMELFMALNNDKNRVLRRDAYLQLCRGYRLCRGLYAVDTYIKYFSPIERVVCEIRKRGVHVRTCGGTLSLRCASVVTMGYLTTYQFCTQSAQPF